MQLQAFAHAHVSSITGTHVQYYKYAYIFHLHYASFSLFLLSDSWRLRGIARVVVVLYASYPLSTLVYFI